jgi:phosphatidate phosphatase APP1
MALLKESLDLKPDSNHSDNLQKRGWRFLIDNERGKDISVRIDNRIFTLSPSQPNGHFKQVIQLDSNTPQNTDWWLSFDTVMPKRDKRQFTGEVQLLSSQGVSVISDIDDTIKQSNVLDKEALLENTFLREYRAVPGMAGMYHRWAKRRAAFHYVTGSPWQLYPPLYEFIADSGFPKGCFFMRYFRLKDSSFIDFLSSAEDFKITSISALIQRYPQRKYILVGDSGEKDPEVYGEIARRYPNQILAILIHNITDEAKDSPRFISAFKDIKKQHWQIFKEVSEIEMKESFFQKEP